MCGIYLLYSKQNKNVNFALNNLTKIQHRGHDSYGMLTKFGKNISVIHEKGKIKHHSGDERGNLFMGHLRYKTSGLSSENGYQPISSSNNFGKFFFIFNGNIPCNEYDSMYTLDSIMIKDFFESESYNCKNWDELLIKFVNTYQRAFSIILATEESIFLLKDRYGARPLCYTFSIQSQTIEAASESVGLAFDSTIFEVTSGEIIGFNTKKICAPRQIFDFNKENSLINKYGGKCIFEYIYFLNPKTIWNNLAVEKIRNKWAESIAAHDIRWKSNNEYIVIGIPTTGISPGIAYAKLLELNYAQGITKNPEVNRTFILSKEERDIVSKKKYIYDSDILKDKRVIIIDDSIVRGVTMKNIVAKIFAENAKEVHIRIISPTIKNICKYGIDIPTKEELIANKKDIPEMTEYFGATSIKFLEIDEMLNVIGQFLPKNTFCSGCFNGDYGDIEDMPSNLKIKE